MTRPGCQETRDGLDAYRRGELAPAAAALVAEHLAGCPDCRRLREADDWLADRLRALPRPPTPPALRQAVSRLAAPSRSGPAAWLARPWVAAAAGAAVVALALAPWVRLAPERPPDVLEALLQSGVAEHRRILLQVEVTPGDVGDATLLFERLRALTQVPVPAAFAGVGQLRLLIARPTVLANRTAAAAALRDPTSPVTTYFVLPGKDLPMPTERRVQIEQYRPHLRQIGEFTVVYWKQGELAFLMVSGRDEATSRQLYLTMRRAL